MSDLTYWRSRRDGKPLVWLEGDVKSPPFSSDGRRKAGWLLRRLQQGEILGLPDSRPMPVVGPRCHELRIRDAEARKTWRIVLRIDEDAVVIADVFAKKTPKTPASVIEHAKKRLRLYDEAVED